MTLSLTQARRFGLGALALAALLAGCRGSGGNFTSTGIVAGASAKYAQQCSAANPYRNQVMTTQAGSLTVEKEWVRAFYNENYLWYDEVPNVDPNTAAYSNETSAGYYNSINSYFLALKTPNLSTSGSGAPKDKFSFTYPTVAWNQLSQSGVVTGYGITYAHYNNKSPNRDWEIVYLEPGSPAASAGLQRGDKLLTVDGEDFVCAYPAGTPDASKPECGTQTGVDKLNMGLTPASNSSHSFTYHRPSTNSTVSVTMTSASVTTTPVPIAKVLTTASNQKVGYILFDTHIVTAERPLRDAISSFQSQGINDLILDIRYNGGGYLYLASELAYMLGGTQTYSGSTSKVFDQTQYNNKLVSPAATPFYNKACEPDASFNCTDTSALPALSLPRVYVIVTGDTCSASEAIINGLRGVGVDVRLIGTTTCGKPYGFTQKDNCGVSYFPIEFRSVNNVGYGDYSDGFLPGGTGTAQSNVPGCRVSDDLTHALGDPTEGMLAATLNYRQNGTCPSTTTASTDSSAAKAMALGVAPAPVLDQGPERTNLITREPKR